MQGAGKTGGQKVQVLPDQSSAAREQSETTGNFQGYQVSGSDSDSYFSLTSNDSDNTARKLSARASLYYEQTGQSQQDVIPSKNDTEFKRYWQTLGVFPKSGVTRHLLMAVKGDTASSVWHVKTPGCESRRERLKRFAQRLVFTLARLTGKARYYNDRQLLAQREVMAGNLYKELMKPDAQYEVAYTFDESSGSHSIASQHMAGYRKGETCFEYLVCGGSKKVEDDYHPAVSLVIRRFLLGDQDWLKLGNYLFKEPESERQGCKWLAIDFGMAFYSSMKIPTGCSLKEFAKRVFTPSKLHRVQYKGRKTVLSYLNQTGRNDQKYARIALEKIAALSDVRLLEICRHVFNPEAREELQSQLFARREQARSILGQQEPQSESLL